MPSFNPSAQILDMTDKPLRTGVIVDPVTRGAIAKRQGEIAKLPEEQRPEAQLALSIQAEEAQTVLTVGGAIISALTNPGKDDDLTATRKLDFFEWAIKVKKCPAGEIVEFSNEDLNTIKERVSRAYPAPLVVGQVMLALKTS